MSLSVFFDGVYIVEEELKSIYFSFGEFFEKQRLPGIRIYKMKRNSNLGEVQINFIHFKLKKQTISYDYKIIIKDYSNLVFLLNKKINNEIFELKKEKSKNNQIDILTQKLIKNKKDFEKLSELEIQERLKDEKFDEKFTIFLTNGNERMDVKIGNHYLFLSSIYYKNSFDNFYLCLLREKFGNTLTF